MAYLLKDLLAKYRVSATTEREKGTYFERLTQAWLRHAPIQQGLYRRVLTFSEWGRERGEDATDTGIDLVAQLADAPDTWCAVQCKFYKEGYRIRREDIDSFFSASGRVPFVRRIFVDTTGVNWTDNAEATLRDQQMETLRISLTDLEDSGIDWGAFGDAGTVRLHEKKQPRQHQRQAVQCVRDGLAEADRGKLIMACGTGKTFTALKIAEDLAGKGGRVLFLVPSLALMQQTVREWSIDSQVPLRSFAVCSDAQVGVRRGRADDLADIDVHDLEIPATTDGAKLAAKATAPDPERMTVLFSTYQSIQAISAAQQRFGLPEFDLIVCDEAHRTTGVTLAGEDESNFVRVHDQAFIAGRKRLYMTATPRVYGEAVQQVARDADAALCSMDDPALFGETLFTRNFGWAVENGLLTDYKVVVLAVNEADVSASVQRRLSDENSELVLDDATKIVGCYKALLKSDFTADTGGDHQPMRRAIAFAKSIAASKLVEAEFAEVAEEWRAAVEAETDADVLPPLECHIRHVDGGFNAKSRDALLSWLKEDTGRADECRILSNARCLSEGVDVPALDAIMFLHPRKSQIDVVQAVGRVMRRAEGKRMGYVILPVGVPAGVEPETALDDNEKYRVVWQVLNALRSHDERLNATINKIDLGVNPGDRIEVIAVTNQLPERATPKPKDMGIGQGGDTGDREPGEEPHRPPAGGEQDQFQFDEFSRAILTRIVRKCGTRTYWEEWARDVARIAEVHVTRIKVAVAVTGSEEKAAFDAFWASLRADLNGAVTADEAVEMLAQHLITRPVFEALFESYSFSASNPVSRALQGVLDVLDRQHLEKEAQGLQRFYDSVRTRAAGIEDAAGKQKIVLELYDKFFRTAFPRLSDRLGIVYTPVEVVDFILRSVDELLRSEFGQTLGSEDVHIIDPFAGTGTFVTRLLQSGLIKPEELEHKYRRGLHANELVLLAYYIAAINIEATYHSLAGRNYLPFEGICLTDTFQLYEDERNLSSELMADNRTRRARQKDLPIRVIVGNPPYSVGQGSANDNAANVDYPELDGRIAATYAAASSASSKRDLYNSYIRALRWASDRIGTQGIIGFVTNGGWVDGNAADGIRLSLAQEFSSIHVFHLRGNQRTSGEQSRREGGKIFGQGSRAPVAITLLVKNPVATQPSVIRFYDIGDYLNRNEKLSVISRFGSIGGIERAGKWQTITPDAHGDWVGQRDTSFGAFLPLGAKDKAIEAKLFETFSLGIATGRDAWCFNASRQALASNMKVMIAAYDGELERFGTAHPNASPNDRMRAVDQFVDPDPKRISWSSTLKAHLARGRTLAFEETCLTPAMYRPFTRQWLYYARSLNERTYQIPRIFPIGSAGEGNRTICVAGPGHITEFTALMTDSPPELCLAAMKGGSQCFPQWVYERTEDVSTDELILGSGNPPVGDGALRRRDAITDAGLAHFQAAYFGETVTKGDLFHYVYGLLHSPDYRARFADNLSKQLPRIPAVATAADFWAFVGAGRELADLHCGFDEVEPYPVNIAQGDLRLAHIADPVRFYRVEKMKFGGKRPKLDRTTVIYNLNITISGIPPDAYDYVVNGKPALEWVMERQCIRTDSASGIASDANTFANETMEDPAYPFKLFCRVITVSLRTMEIVRSLPPLDIAQIEAAGSEVLEDVVALTA